MFPSMLDCLFQRGEFASCSLLHQMLALFVAGLLISAVIVGLQFVSFGGTRKLYGVYSEPNAWFWLKFWLARALVKLQRKRKAKSNEEYAGDVFRMSDADRLKRLPVGLMEKIHELPADLPYAGDCIFFNGANSEGFFFTFGFAQRQNSAANLFCVLKVPNRGTFVNEELLQSSNVKTCSTTREYRTESGFRVVCEKPMGRWRLRFDGMLVEAKNLKQNLKEVGEDDPPANVRTFRTSFEFEWNAKGDFFNFETDVSPDMIARSLALEPWSRQMFKKLEAKHQIHYEQFGQLSGNLQIDDQNFDVQLTSMRDHTIAPYRRWTDMRRYVMVMFHLKDGTCVNTTVVSIPEAVFSHLQFGYIIEPEGNKVAIRELNLRLPFIGEDKRFPPEFEYSFETENSHQMYEVKVRVQERLAFKMGLDLACYIEELMCEFEVNGQKGYGLCEIEYRIRPY
ncbi:hypothetical protein M3Y99_01287800 [Aphelenchoides fujianensis]|nr:hypothetical protein M3Y99_01287800 [Aphelenchoides fujianensis]